MRTTFVCLQVLALFASSQALAVDRPPSRRTTSSPPRPSSPSSSSSASGKPQATPRAGSSQSQNWYQRRKVNKSGVPGGRGGTRSRVNSPKPPKWEKEGDDLYREIVFAPSTGGDGRQQSHLNEKITYAQAQAMLKNVTSAATQAVQKITTTVTPTIATTIEPTNTTIEPPFMWGGLSVGPVWKTRLLQAGFTRPTPVQYDAFQIIATAASSSSSSPSKSAAASNKNVIVASPTGTGKSLAFLLPLLTAGTNDKLPGMIWIVTPTTELARQLQGVVAQLLCASGKNDDDSNAAVTQLCQVLEMPKSVAQTESNDDDDGDDNSNSEEDDSTSTTSIVSTIGQAPLLMGTPKLFLQLSKEIRQAGPGTEDRHLRRMLRDNLHTIVLDEADRLLQTETVARQEILRREIKEEQQQRREQPDGTVPQVKSTKANAIKLRRLDPTHTELLLQKLLMTRNQRSPSGNGRTNVRQLQRQEQQLRVICASATVGRTLRRQVMQLVGAISMDQAAVLVTDRIRTKKDAMARRANLLPDTLSHKYYLLQQEQQKQEKGKDADKNSPVLTEVSNMIATLPPAPMLIFPGRIGVRTLQLHLRDHAGMTKVRGLEDIQFSSSSESSSLDAESTTASASWQDTPVYVVSEKLGRGLDIPEIGYVVLLQVPSSAAGYTHLAGRTGRNGSEGTAISICAPRQAPKLCIIAETLGLHMEQLLTTTPLDDSLTSTAKDSVEEPSIASVSIREPENEEGILDESETTTTKDTSIDWTRLSPSALKRRTVPQMKQYLNDNGVTPERSMKKLELLEAVEELLNRA